MNDTISLLLATTILAVGGVGLYMYKSDDSQKGGDIKKGSDDYNEDTIFGSGNLWSEDEDEYADEKPIEDESFYEPPVRSRGSKTKRNRKSVGTKRRYYR